MTYTFALPEIMNTEPQYLINPQSRVTYTYDAAGNRLTMENDEGIEEYTYNAANQLIMAGDIRYEYDERGNLTTEKNGQGEKAYAYDGRNLLSEVAYSDGTYARYGYDGLGRMVYREEANYDLNKIKELQQSMENSSNKQSGKEKTNNGNGQATGNDKGYSSANGNDKGNGNSSGNSNNNNENAGGNGFGKYNNPGQGNKYGIYKKDNQEIKFEPTDIEKTRYLYLGQSDMLHKEYSPKGSPYAEYYQANGQVISQKMFGLHGRITPGKEETLNTNGGLMYYQYDGTRNVTGLTNRHGDEIENYRYDAFGNIFTGITAPYNAVGYTGQQYDDKSGLINMNARWYNSNSGRFITEDIYSGDMYNPQSLNRYAYVMNNPVNMWDPTGHVPEWVGDSYYIVPMPDNMHVDYYYALVDNYSSASDWSLINKITNSTEIIYKYQSTITNIWEYIYYDFSYTASEDPETGETIYEFSSMSQSNVTYSTTDYYYKDVVQKASEIAQQNEQYIKNLAGDPPKSSDPPMVSISTRQVNNRPVEVLDSDAVILRNTEVKPTATQKLIAGAVQSELNSILGAKLVIDGWYGSNTASAASDLQKALSLPATGVLDVKTFYQMQVAYESGAKYMYGVQTNNAGENSKLDRDIKGTIEIGKDMLWPTESQKITSQYGYRVHPITGEKKFHSGVDIAPIKSGIEGDAVLAASSGIVAKTGYQFDPKTKTGLGNYVIIESTVNDKKIRTVYAHLKNDSINVEQGTKINVGKQIAEMGKTGGVTGVHLHFEVRVYGSKNKVWDTVDPESYKYDYNK